MTEPVGPQLCPFSGFGTHLGAGATPRAALTAPGRSGWAAPRRGPGPCAAGAAHPSRRRVPPGCRAPCRRVRVSHVLTGRGALWPGRERRVRPPEEQDWAAVPRVITPAARVRRGQPPPATRSARASALPAHSPWAGPLAPPCGPPGPLGAGHLSGLHHRGRGVTSGVTGSHCLAVRIASSRPLVGLRPCGHQTALPGNDGPS